MIYDAFTQINETIQNVMNDIGEENNRMSLIRQANNLSQTFYLEQENLFAIRFSKGVDVDVHLDDGTCSLRYQDLSQKEAEEIVENEYETRLEKIKDVFRNIKNEIAISPGLTIEMPSETIESEIPVEENKPEELPIEENLEPEDIPEQIKQKKKKFYADHVKAEQLYSTGVPIFSYMEQSVYNPEYIQKSQESMCAPSGIENFAYSQIHESVLNPNYDAPQVDIQYHENIYNHSNSIQEQPLQAKNIADEIPENIPQYNPYRESIKTSSNHIGEADHMIEQNMTAHPNIPPTDKYAENTNQNVATEHTLERLNADKNIHQQTITDVPYSKDITKRTNSEEGKTETTVREAEVIQEWKMKFTRDNFYSTGMRYQDSLMGTATTVTSQEENDTAYQGAHALKALVAPLVTTADIYGAALTNAFYDDIQKDIAKITSTAGQGIADGKISSDLFKQDDTAIREQLLNTGYSNDQISAMIRNKDTIFNKMDVQANIITKMECGELSLSEKEKEFLYSSDFLGATTKSETYLSILQKDIVSKGYDFMDEKPISQWNTGDIKKMISLIQIDGLKNTILQDAEKLNLDSTELDYLQQFFMTGKDDAFEKKILHKFCAGNNIEINGFEKMFPKEIIKVIKTKVTVGDTKTEFELFEMYNKARRFQICKFGSSIKKLNSNFREAFRTLLNDDTPADPDDYLSTLRTEKNRAKSILNTTRMTFKIFSGVNDKICFVSSIPGRGIAMLRGKSWGWKIVAYQKTYWKNGKIMSVTKHKWVQEPYEGLWGQKKRKAQKLQAKKEKKEKKYAEKSRKKYENGQKRKRKAKETLSHFNNIKPINPIQTKLSLSGQKIANTGLGNTIKKIGKGGKKAGKFISKAATFIKSPFQYLGKLFSSISHTKKMIMAAISSFLVSLIEIYIVLLFLSWILDAILNIGADTYTHVILTEPKNVQDMAEEIQQKDQERFVKALDIGLNPISDGKGNDTVYGNYHVTYYGIHTQDKEEITKQVGTRVGNSKTYTLEEKKYNYTGSQTVEGYHIYYIDSQGNPIGNNTSNVKDCIAMAAVMYSNSAEDSTYKNYIKRAAMDLWEILNPDFTVVESEIYYDDQGCHYYPEAEGTSDGTSIGTYYCNDSSYYTNVAQLKNDGVYFFEEPVEQTDSDKGCRYTIKCNGHEEGGGPGPDGIDGTDDDDKPTTTYHEDISGVVADGIPSGCDDCEIEYSCPGHDGVAICPGHKNANIYITILSFDDVKAYPNGQIKYKVPDTYNEDGNISSMKEIETNINIGGSGKDYESFESNGKWTDAGNVGLVDNFISGDWAELYGATVDDVVAHIQGRILSNEDTTELMSFARVSNDDEKALEFVNYAINYTGRIRYNFGSKATGIGEAGISNGKLDCSGFVSWCYGSITGSMPSGQGTANFVGSVNGKRIPYSELKAGDVGLISVPGSSGNHIGIYVGKDADGNDMWCHCNSRDKTVSVNNVSYFRYYYRLQF